MDQLPEIESAARRPESPGSIRVLAQALQMFDDRPPRNRMELAISRKLAEQMRRVVRQPASVEQVTRLAAEFPAVEALVDDFLMNARILRARASHYGVLDDLMQRLVSH
jgi:hypothetical protein